MIADRRRQSGQSKRRTTRSEMRRWLRVDGLHLWRTSAHQAHPAKAERRSRRRAIAGRECRLAVGRRELAWRGSRPCWSSYSNCWFLTIRRRSGARPATKPVAYRLHGARRGAAVGAASPRLAVGVRSELVAARGPNRAFRTCWPACRSPTGRAHLAPVPCAAVARRSFIGIRGTAPAGRWNGVGGEEAQRATFLRPDDGIGSVLSFRSART